MSTPLPVLSCTDPPCGACCMHIGVPPGYGFFCPPEDTPMLDGVTDLPDYAIWLAMPERLRATLRKYYRAVAAGEIPDRMEEGMPCCWFDHWTRRCRHHEHRPSICRKFAPGEEACLRLRREQGITS